MHTKHDSNGRLKKQPPEMDTGWKCLPTSSADKRWTRRNGDYALAVDLIDGKWSATAHHKYRGHVATISSPSAHNAAATIERYCGLPHAPIGV